MRSHHVRSLLVVMAIGCALSALAEDAAPQDAEPAELSLDEGGAPPLAPPDPSVLEFPTHRWACTLVLGGGGAVLDDAKGDAAFQELNGAVTEALYSFFFVNQYRVQRLVLDTRDPDERTKTALAEMSKRRCSKMIRLSHFLKSSPIKPTFGFDVSILVPTPSAATETGGQTWVLKTLFEKRFEYPFTQTFLSTASPESFANLIGRDLAKSEPMER